MVINCVTTPEQRGRMLTLCYNQLRPGGVCFLTLPKLCLIQSKYMTRSYFEQILTKGVGFELDSTKDSPKLAFFVLKRPESKPVQVWNEKFARTTTINKGKKFRNTFAVILDQTEVTRWLWLFYINNELGHDQSHIRLHAGFQCQYIYLDISMLDGIDCYMVTILILTAAPCIYVASVQAFLRRRGRGEERSSWSVTHHQPSPIRKHAALLFTSQPLT